MKKLFLFAMLAASVSAGSQQGSGQSAGERAAYKVLARAEVDALLATPANVLVLDVRSPGEIAFNGAFPVWLSIETDEGDTAARNLARHLAEVPKDKPIMTVSGGANRAGFAADLLAKNGFKVAGAVSTSAYVRDGGTLIKHPPYHHWSMDPGGKPPSGNPTAARDEPKAYKELHKDDIDALLRTPEKVLFIDVRSPGEIAHWGALPVFLDIETAEGDSSAKGMAAHMAEIPKDRILVTVSGRANRGGVAGALLAKNGFNVAGGFGAMTYGEEGGKLLIKHPPYQPPTPR
jgi:rhodanese-related sulfurtransferase